MFKISFYIILFLFNFSVLEAKSFIPYDHVLLIGIDGMGSHNLYDTKKWGVRPPRIKTINHLKNNGAWSLNVKIDHRNWSGPNWMSIFTGVFSDVHGVHGNGCEKVRKAPPTLFKRLRDEFPSAEMGILYNWKTLGCYPEQGTVNFNKKYNLNPGGHLNAVKYLKRKRPKFFFFYTSSVDWAGHQAGSASNHYRWTLQRTDKVVGKVLKTLKRTGMDKNTLVILTSDHGHDLNNKDHSSKDFPVPIFVFGPRVKKGQIKEDLDVRVVTPLILYALTGKPQKNLNLKDPSFKFLFEN